MSGKHFEMTSSRRRFLQATAGTAVAGMSLSAFSLMQTATAVASVITITPRYGAGVFNVDPDQSRVSQSPSAVVTGNIRFLPLDLAL